MSTLVRLYPNPGTSAVNHAGGKQLTTRAVFLFCFLLSWTSDGAKLGLSNVVLPYYCTVNVLVDAGCEWICGQMGAEPLTRSYRN